MSAGFDTSKEALTPPIKQLFVKSGCAFTGLLTSFLLTLEPQVLDLFRTQT
ncbi:hypothetical protein RB2150_02154 [Rhodobacteraceae bacterium HTCC2150]|nr:hypothetical protein RB2150_02154 [Rhodobacteraceae bacterium HTCC2150]